VSRLDNDWDFIGRVSAWISRSGNDLADGMSRVSASETRVRMICGPSWFATSHVGVIVRFIRNSAGRADDHEWGLLA
jgi:hypothetical protein